MERHKSKLAQAKRIAIVRTDKLGDMVLTLPMLNAIKEINPNAELDVIASSYTELLLKGQDLISQYHLIDKVSGGIEQIFASNKYDVVLFPRPRFDEIFAAFKHRIPLRIGSGYRWYSFLLNHKVYEHRKTAEKNEGQYNVDLINSITGASHKAVLIKPFISDDVNLPIEIISQFSGKEKIIIHPGGGGSAPKWSADNFAKLANMIIDEGHYDIIISGTKEESSLADEIMRKTNFKAINLCGYLKLDEMMKLISMSKCLIANSTGVLHIAAACGISVIGFYPNTPSMSSKRWGALTDKAVFLSPPLSSNPMQNDDLNHIPPETAFLAFISISK